MIKGPDKIALVGIVNKHNKVITRVQELCDKQGLRIDAEHAELAKIEKLHPKTFVLRNDWMHQCRKYFMHIRRFEYYLNLSKRMINEDTEYIDILKGAGI